MINQMVKHGATSLLDSQQADKFDVAYVIFAASREPSFSKVQTLRV